MGLFDSNTTAQTTTQVPWDAAQPYLKNVMSGAQALQTAGTGYTAGPLSNYYTPYSDTTNAALNGINQIAQWGDPQAYQSIAAVSGAISGQNPLYGQSQQALSGILGGTSGQANPYFQDALNNQMTNLGNTIQQQFSGLGRLGSAADTGALASQLGQVSTNALSQQYNQDVANKINAAQASGNLYSQGVQNRLAGVAAAPGAYQQQYLPLQYEAQVGAAQDAQNQALASANQQIYNTNDMSGWNRLNALSNLVGGGALANSATKTTSIPSNPIGSALGGALSGASALPGTLAPYGALGGGILGLLSGL